MAKIISILTIVILTGCAQNRMYLLPGDLTANKEQVQRHLKSRAGTFHALPRTVAQVTAAVTRIERNDTPLLGQLDDTRRDEVFLKLGIKPYNRNTGDVSYSLSKTQMALADIPDMNAIVFSELTGHINKNNEYTRVFDDDGTPISFKSSSEDVTLEQVSELLGVVGRIASPLKLGGPAPHVAAPPKVNIVLPEIATIIRNVGDLREARAKLIQNEFVSDPDVLKRQLFELDKKELELLSKLVATETQVWMPRTLLDPADAVSGELPIMSIDSIGITVAAGRELVPPLPSGWSPNGSRNPKTLALRVYRPSGETLAGKAATAKPQPTGGKNWKKPWGLVYRIPAAASLQLAFDNSERELVAGQIAQFGEIRVLPPHLNSTSASIDAELYPLTGALKTLHVKSNAIKPSTIKTLGSGFETVATAYGAKQTTAATANATQDAAALGFAQAIVTTTLGAVLK